MKEITAREVQERLEAGKLLNLIDVRELEEVAEAHIEGIIHIPLSELQDRIGVLDKNKEYILVCRSSARSGNAASYLESIGFQATNMVGGMLVWKGKTVKNFKTIIYPMEYRRNHNVNQSRCSLGRKRTRVPNAYRENEESDERISCGQGIENYGNR